MDLAVDADPRESGEAHVLDELAVLALSVIDDGRHQQVFGALFIRHQRVDDLLRGLRLHCAPALVTALLTHPGVEHSEIVVNLRDGPDRGTRILTDGLLLDADGG